MLCEERGFFLEIADLIRGMGLTILKGVMEARDDKIWARFAVEVSDEHGHVIAVVVSPLVVICPQLCCCRRAFTCLFYVGRFSDKGLSISVLLKVEDEETEPCI